MKSNTDLVKEELENLTGKIYNGDLTPLVFNLLENSTDLQGLLKQLTGETINTLQEDTVEQPKSAPNFENWLKGCLRIE